MLTKHRYLELPGGLGASLEETVSFDSCIQHVVWGLALGLHDAPHLEGSNQSDPGWTSLWGLVDRLDNQWSRTCHFRLAGRVVELTAEVEPGNQAAQGPDVYGLGQGQTQHHLWSPCTQTSI